MCLSERQNKTIVCLWERQNKIILFLWERENKIKYYVFSNVVTFIFFQNVIEEVEAIVVTEDIWHHLNSISFNM